MCLFVCSGSQYAADGNFSFTFEAGVKIKKGKNYISLLSGTIGHAVCYK